MKRLLVIGLVVALLVACVSSVAAQSTTAVYLGQSNVALVVGQEVDVPILVSNAADWYGVDVRLAYNPAVVQVVSVTRGVIPKPDFVVWERYDNTLGMAYYVTTQLNPTLPANGSGVIVTVRLRGIADGTTPLTLTVQAANRNGFMIPVTIVSGQAVVGQPTATLVPTATSTPVIVPPTSTPAPAPTAISKFCRFMRGRWICIALID